MASVHDLTHESGFIFEAQLMQLGASTASGYPATPETAVVRVTKIVKSTPTLAGYEGQLITVHLQSTTGHQVGQQTMFFTHGLHYGDGLVVNEVGSVTGTGALTMSADLTSAAQASDDREMTQRLAQAELVVSGVASTPRPHVAPLAAAAAPTPPPRVSEHDPDWWSCTITIDSVEKGDHAAKTTDVLYANSMDVAWFRSPKIKAGDHGVFCLHNRDHYGKAVPALAATHPLDFRPIADAPRLRSLLK